MDGEKVLSREKRPKTKGVRDRERKKERGEWMERYTICEDLKTDMYIKKVREKEREIYRYLCR